MDRDLIALRRTAAHQLGFAVQMCTVRYVGWFLVDDPLDVPWSVIEHLAAQQVGVGCTQIRGRGRPGGHKAKRTFIQTRRAMGGRRESVAKTAYS